MTTTEHWTTIVLIAIGIALTVPVGLHVIEAQAVAGRDRIVGSIAGSGALLSLVLPPSILTALLAVPWLAVASGFALRVVRRLVGDLPVLVRDPTRLVDGLLVVAAPLWWVNAGIWLVAHRSGISLNDHLEVVGAMIITIALAGWALVAIGPMRRSTDDRIARVLLVVSAVAWVLPMFLAVGWALRPFVPDPLVTTFQVMLELHAAVNAIGLVLAGLFALSRLRPAIDPDTRPVPTRRDSLVAATPRGPS